MSTFRANLLKARGSLVFLFGLTFAFGLVMLLELWDPNTQTDVAAVELRAADINVELREQRGLTAQEMQWAEIAWSYFENNTQETGFVNSADQYSSATLWDLSSYLLGMISAERLEIISTDEFNRRVNALLSGLTRIALFDKRLPNKAYNTATLSMSTYNNDATDRGIGWSAIDIARFMVPLNVLVWHYPQFSIQINELLSQWDMQAMVLRTEMIGARVDDLGQTEFVQEGRLGYEEYAAKSMSLMGIDLGKAVSYVNDSQYVNVYGIDVATDTRTPDEFAALNFVVSEPYILDGLEFGWDTYSREYAKRVYAVQERRYKETGVLTAVSEDNIDVPPYFVYNTIFADGKVWNAVTEKGEDAAEFKSLSTKAAFGFYALYQTEYTDKLIDFVKDNHDPVSGWYSGIYESTGLVNTAQTANTNGIILESLHYIVNGPFMSLHRGYKKADL